MFDNENENASKKSFNNFFYFLNFRKRKNNINIINRS